MPIWPFKPREALSESLEWRTDIIQTKTAEQRFALRTAPRRIFNLSHTLTNFEYTAARALVTQQESYSIPDWPIAINVGAINPSSNPEINFTETDLGLEAGDSVLLWQSNTLYESCQVISVTSNGVELDSIDNIYTDARMIPLLTGNVPRGLEPSRPAGNFIDCQFQPIIIESDNIAESSYSRYRSHDLVDDCPVVASDAFNEGLFWPVVTIDNVTGEPDYIVNRDVIDATFQMRWHVFKRSELFTLRKFIYSRRGRWKSFWLSSFARDFEIAETLGASDTTLRVYAPANIADLGVTTFDIEIKVQGVSYYRQVESYNPGAEVNGRQTIVFTIDSQLGVEVTAGNLNRISFLRHIRFDADRIDLNHRANSGTIVSVPCKMVPL